MGVLDSTENQPVEQGEQIGCTVDEGGCAVAIRADIPAPSETELPLIATVESWIEDRTKAVTWGTNNGSSWLGVLTGDLQIILDSLREIQQLRKQLAQLRQDTTELVADRDRIASEAVTRIERLQQQLAQIRDATFTAVGCWECPNAIQAAQTIAALKADNAQKDKRIAELEGGK